MPAKTAVKPVWFPLYVQDFLASTHVATMTTEAIGAYILMLMTAWNDATCSLPNNDEALARITRLGERWSYVKLQVIACFTVQDDRLVNNRLLLERRKATAIVVKCSKAGKVSSLKRWKGHDKTAKSKAKITSVTSMLVHGDNQSQSQSQESSKNQTLNLSKTEPPRPNGALTKTDTLLPSSAMTTCRFDQFWHLWPKKRAKEDAHKAWQKIEKDGMDDALFRQILQAVECWKNDDSWTKDGGQFIPYPATWLRGKRWHDKPQCEVGSGTVIEWFLNKHASDTHDEQIWNSMEMRST